MPSRLALVVLAALSCLLVAAGVARAADLVVTELELPPHSGTGLTITIFDTTTNLGTTPSPPTRTRIYFSVDKTLQPSDPEIGFRDVPALQPGESSTGPSEVTFPDGLPRAFYSVFARADADSVVAEDNEGNNLKRKLINLGPDLFCIGISAPMAAAPGSTITVTNTVKNEHDSGTANPSTAAIYLSPDGTVASAILRASRPVPELLGGEENTGPMQIEIPPSLAVGTYYLVSIVDDLDEVDERSELNQSRIRPIRIGPDLVVASVSAPSGVTPGVAFLVGDSTKNAGAVGVTESMTSFYLSPNGVSRDIFLGSRPVPGLAVNQTNKGTVQVTVPVGTPAGSYLVIGVANDGGAALEADLTNNTRKKAIVVN
jgi:hypothetical protein